MKSSTSDLFDLVQSLSKGEKAYFTKKALKHYGNADAAYIKLFNVLCILKEYDEIVVMKKINYRIKGSFSTLKNYLYEQILETLIDYQKNSNRIIEANRDLQELNILANRGLTGQYLKKWKKAYKNANLFEDFPYIFTLKEQLQSLQLNFVVKTDEKGLQALVRENKELLSAYNELQQVRNLYLAIQLINKQSQIRSSKQELLQVVTFEKDPILQVKYENKTFRFRFYSRMCRAILHYLSHKYDAALAILEEVQKDLLTHYFIPIAKPYMYLDFMQIYYTVTFVCKKYQAFFGFIENPIKDHFKNLEQQATIFGTRSRALLRYTNSTARYDEALQHSRAITAQLPQYNEKIPLDLRRNLIGSLAISFFVLGEYDDAFAYCKEAMALQHHAPQKDTRQFLYLFCILVAYEMDNYQILENEIKNAYHFFYRTLNLKAFEKGMISFLKKIMQHIDKNTRKVLFTELKILLDKFRKDPVSLQVFRYFNFDAWVESKIEGISYKAYMIRRVAKEQ
jgi:hypothetical protein